MNPPALRAITLTGIGLHSGRAGSLTLSAIEGPVVFRTARGDVRIADLDVLRTDLGVRVACPRVGLDVDSVEHLLAALGGLSLHDGVALEVEGPELPLLDGAARVFADALVTLGARARTTDLVVVRAGMVEVGEARYEFEPGSTVALAVKIAFAEPGIGTADATWDGTSTSFLADIAWARTFGFRRDAGRLRATGRASGANPEAVMILDDAGHVEAPGAPAQPGEFARHKLLDLIGDLHLSGGPPVGTVRAFRPGHAATNRAMKEALRRGLVAPRA